jgi:glycosyltransferase involved in cell wall biosynthesis
MSGPDDIASPWDLLARSRSPLHPRFRRLEGEPPEGLPHGFTLGTPIAPGNDWTIFAEEANARGQVESGHRVLIAYEPATPQDAEDFSASLKAQIFAGSVELTLHGPGVGRPPVREHEAAVPDADTVIYLSGRCVLDPLALERICRMTRIGRLIAVPLAEAAARPERAVSVAATATDWPAEEPYRAVRGLNLAVSAALARAAGRPNSTGAEFACRCAQQGAYFAPVFVPELAAEAEADEAGNAPRTSIVVSTAGGVWGLASSLDSVVAQSERDIEICVWGDGPLVRLVWPFLKRRFGKADLRLIRAARLGEAIAATTGQYVGVLEAGDRLGRDAVRAAVERLSRADIIAVRLREVTREGKASKTWGRPSGDRLLTMPETSGFTMLRPSAWARIGTTVERSTLFDALAGLGPVETTRTDQFTRFKWRRRSAETPSGRTQAALVRQGLARYWTAGTEATVVRRSGSRLVVFWPDYSRSNLYQRLLYGTALVDTEYMAGDIDAAVGAARSLGNQTVFHIHWTNRIFRVSEDETVVRAKAAEFLAKVGEFKQLGGSVVWTIHNIASHDTRHFRAEIEFAQALTALADRIHIHALSSLPEIEAHYPIARAKLRVARHGNYFGAYADYIPRSLARRELGLVDDDDVLLFTGSLRSYKGPSELVAAFKRLLPANPNLRLILAGDAKGSDAAILDGISEAERRRILLVDRFLDNDELQLVLRAADIGVYPYDAVLTSGSILLALSFGLPIVAPRFGMISEAVGDAGALYERDNAGGLEAALSQMLDTKHAGGLQALRATALAAAERNTWQSFAGTVLGDVESI